MDATGDIHLNAPPHLVWEAMRDPEVLKASVPGCKAVQVEGPYDYRMDLDGTWGPIRAHFHVHVRIEEIRGLSDGFPDSYRLSARGEGALGLAAGHSDITLRPDGRPDGAQTTVLTYAAAGEPDSMLARLGDRLLRRAAGKLSEKFFKRFANALEKRTA